MDEKIRVEQPRERTIHSEVITISTYKYVRVVTSVLCGFFRLLKSISSGQNVCR
jgi:hypothetical protein